MTRLFLAVFGCFVLCVIGPGVAVYYFNMDYFDELRWQSRLAAAERLLEQAEQVHKQFKELERHLGILKETEARKSAKEAIVQLGELHRILGEGAIEGSETRLSGALYLAIWIALILALGLVCTLCYLTIKYVCDWRVTRMIAGTVLGDAGINVRAVPANERLRLLQLLGACKWHLGQVKKLLDLKRMPVEANGAVGLLKKTFVGLHGLFDRTDLPSISPVLSGSRHLASRQTKFAAWKMVEQKRLRAEETVLGTKVAAGVRNELARHEAACTERQKHLETWQKHLEEDRRQFTLDVHAFQRDRLELQQERQLVARDRDRSIRDLHEALQTRDAIAQFCVRIDAGVQYVQNFLATNDLGGDHPAHPAIIFGLAAALDSIAPHRNGELAYVI